jgi:hypothetical protein
MFDEETGEAIRSRDRKGYAERTGKTPCEASIGCAKGHYNDNPDLNAKQEAVISLYQASKVSGGAMLNEAERSDWWLLQTFAAMREIEDRVSRQSLEQSILAGVLSGR